MMPEYDHLTELIAQGKARYGDEWPQVAVDAATIVRATRECPEVSIEDTFWGAIDIAHQMRHL